ncbi:MAG: complex I NDUFA9 subunit family protein [Rickettsiales bacterium]
MNQYPLITIVGGSGFVGRHTVKLLASAGYRIRILVRDTVAAEFLKTSATVGQIAIEHVDITRPETLAGKFKGSVAVISLVSILYESGHQKFSAINIAGAKAVATEAAKAGVPTLVHVSALGIEQATDTVYGKTKLEGEHAVRAVFPSATILRPSLIIGPEDGFFQRFGRMSMFLPALPIIGGGKNKFQPVLVTDVAKALLSAITSPDAQGKTFEITGPQVYSFKELLQLMAMLTKRTPRLVSIPPGLAKVKGFFCELLPFKPIITRDQVKLLKHDSVASAGAAGLKQLGIAAEPIEARLSGYLARFAKV